VATALIIALGHASRAGFRVNQFSIQRNHIHLLCEADTCERLTRGIQGLAIRLAKTVNRTLVRRGGVWEDRFHARALATPREVRNALVYVLRNVAKHEPGAHGIDPYSSGRWFDGWKKGTGVASGATVAAARTWLLSVGWRRWGPIGFGEAPGTAVKHARRCVPRGRTDS
jgi:hypothetical protein